MKVLHAEFAALMALISPFAVASQELAGSGAADLGGVNAIVNPEAVHAPEKTILSKMATNELVH